MVTIVKQTPRNFVPPPPKPGTQTKAAPRVEMVGDSSIVP